MRYIFPDSLYKLMSVFQPYVCYDKKTSEPYLTDEAPEEARKAFKEFISAPLPERF